MTYFKEGLFHIIFGCDINSWLAFGAIHFGESGNGRTLYGPTGEQCFNLLLHIGSGKIALNHQRYVGRKVVAGMKAHKILTGDGLHVFVFNLAAKHGIAPINNAFHFARSNGIGIIITTANGTAKLVLQQVHFVLTEFRVSDHVLEYAHDLSSVFLETGEGNGGFCIAHSAFHSCSDVFQLLIQLIACLGFCTTATQNGTGHFRHAHFACGVKKAARANDGGAVNQRQRMIFHQI